MTERRKKRKALKALERVYVAYPNGIRWGLYFGQINSRFCRVRFEDINLDVVERDRVFRSELDALNYAGQGYIHA